MLFSAARLRNPLARLRANRRDAMAIDGTEDVGIEVDCEGFLSDKPNVRTVQDLLLRSRTGMSPDFVVLANRQLGLSKRSLFPRSS